MNQANSTAPIQSPPVRSIIQKDRQRKLLNALRSIDGEHPMAFSLADMYYGALACLGDMENPERFTASAHCLRELIEKLPDLPPSFIPVAMRV